MVVGEVLNIRAAEKGEKIVASFLDQKISYRELEEKSNQVANGLIDLGIQVGDMVSILLPNSIEFLVAYFGVLKSGATMVPINIMFKSPAVEYILNNSEAKVIITSQAFLPVIQGCNLKHLREIITIDEGKIAGCRSFSELLQREKTYPQLEDLTADSVAACLYTSGSTGDPKGAMLTHHNLVFDTESTIKHLKVDDQGCYLCVLPMFHAFAETVCMLMPVFLGASMVIMKSFIPERVLKVIQDYQVTFFAGVPTMYQALLNVKNRNIYDISHLKLCLSGGAAMPLKTLDDFEEVFGATIVEGNGPTETSPVAYSNPVDGVRKPGSVGLPIPGVTVRIVNEEDKELPRGEIGEIVVQGDNVMKGYFKKPEATAKALRNGWLHTGDLGKMDEDGYVYIVDRIKDMINVGGMNVYPREIEEQLYKHPKILEAAVVANKDELRGEVPKAYIVLREGEEATEREMITYCMQSFANYKIPKLIEFIPVLPKNATGKVDKKALRNRSIGVGG